MVSIAVAGAANAENMISRIILWLRAEQNGLTKKHPSPKTFSGETINIVHDYAGALGRMR